MTQDLGRVDTRIISVDGSTVLLSLATNGAALFSVDGGAVWNYVRTKDNSGEGETTSEYTFTTGILENNGIVTIDTKVIPTLDPDTSQIRLSQLPATLPIHFDNGLSVDSFHKLSVSDPNTPGNIVVLPTSGVLPSELLPGIVYGTGIKILEDGTVSIDSSVVATLVDGKIPDELLPSAPEQIVYTAGDGIRISDDHVISEDWKDYR